MESGAEGGGRLLHVLRAYADRVAAQQQEGAPAVRVEVDERVGRHLVAARELAEGKCIIREQQMMAAPRTAELCIGCLSRSAAELGCMRCGWPQCEKCAAAGQQHVDCALLAPLRTLRPWQRWRAPGGMLMVLRALLMRDSQPELFRIVDALQDNVSSLGRTAWMPACMQHVIEPVQTDCGLEVPARTIAHLAGVFDTNSFTVSVQDDLEARALFPLLCLMTHDCSPNTNRFYDDGVATLVATRPIRTGEMITTSYTSSLWGTDARQTHLAATKCFQCTCRRCQDPSEFGTNITAIRCRSGATANLPGNIGSEGCGGLCTCRHDNAGQLCWQCDRCDQTVSLKQMRLANQLMAVTMGNTLARRDLKNIERWEVAHSPLLGPDHQFLLEIRLHLLDLYAEDACRDAKCDAERLRRRSRCHEISTRLLAVTSQLEPGPTLLRGRLLCHLVESTLPGDDCTKADVAGLEKLAAEAAHILRYDGRHRGTALRTLQLAQKRSADITAAAAPPLMV